MGATDDGPAGRPARRLAGRPAGRPGGARVVSGAEKKKFDRGGPVWPPQSNVTNDRLVAGSWAPGGALPSQPKIGGAAPPSQNFCLDLTPFKLLSSMTKETLPPGAV